LQTPPSARPLDLTDMTVTKLAFQPWYSSSAQPARQRDTIVVAGEFEVGKSSVVNALLRRNLLPNDPGFLSRPLVKIRHHHTTVISAKLSDGSSIEADCIDDLVERDDVVSCVIHTPLPKMEAVEIVEIPFDPTHGFDPEHHEIMRTAGLFIWGTIASQAWRLSEKTIIQTLPEEMRERSVLAITRADKLISSNDLDLIERRLQKEAAPFFNELVFMQASTKNLTASETSEAGWRETGGYTLFEVASDVIGELTIADEVLLNAMEELEADNSREHADLMGSNEAEAILAEHDMDNEFRVVEDTSENTFFVKNNSDEQLAIEPATELEPAPARNPVAAVLGNEVAFSFSESVDKDETESVKAREQVDADIEPVVEAELPSNASLIADTPERDEAVSQTEVENDPVVESVEEEPQTDAQKIAHAVDNIAGLTTAGVGDAASLELLVSFKEGESSAEQCVEAFSAMIKTDVEAMAQLKTEDHIREVILAVSDHLILLQILDDDNEKFAFFVLESDQTNAGIASMTTKRLLNIWRDSGADC